MVSEQRLAVIAERKRFGGGAGREPLTDITMFLRACAVVNVSGMRPSSFQGQEPAPNCTPFDNAGRHHGVAARCLRANVVDEHLAFGGLDFERT
jgi:hypothetical protein